MPVHVLYRHQDTDTPIARISPRRQVAVKKLMRKTLNMKVEEDEPTASGINTTGDCYVNITCATDTENVSFVFKCKNIICKEILGGAGLL